MAKEATAIKESKSVLSKVLVRNLSELTEEEKVEYYQAYCESVGLNPLTKPLEYVELDGKLTLYARRDCADQLRKIHGVSIKILDRELVDGVYTVRAQAIMPNGREDESIGAVPFTKEGGEWKQSQNGKRYFAGTGVFQSISPTDRALGAMKAETKAKRRVTLSICGLGILDESELEDAMQSHRDAARAEERAMAADKKAEEDPGLRIVPKAKAKPVVEMSQQEARNAAFFAERATQTPAEETPAEAPSNTATDEDIPAASDDPPAETPEQAAQRQLREHVARLVPTLDNIANLHCSKFVSAYAGDTKALPELERIARWEHALVVLEDSLHENPAEVDQLRENPSKYARNVRARAEAL